MNIFKNITPIGMLETGMMLAGTLAEAGTELTGLNPGDSVQLPKGRIGLNGTHYDVYITVMRDPAPVAVHDPTAVGFKALPSPNPGTPQVFPAAVPSAALVPQTTTLPPPQPVPAQQPPATAAGINAAVLAAAGVSPDQIAWLQNNVQQIPG